MTARIGLIIPSSNRMVEQEAVRYLPAETVAHVARLRMTGVHHVTIDRLLPRVEAAAAMLADARCGVIGFHCTANSMAEGAAGETKLLATLRQAGAAQATTTATAIRRALQALDAHRIVLITPYSAHTTEEEAAFLHQEGLAVIDARGFALKGSDEYCRTPAQFWRDRAFEAARPQADTYLISCANISVFPVIDEIERHLDRPVVTSNQAILWEAMSLLDLANKPKGPGRLFEHAPVRDSAATVPA